MRFAGCGDEAIDERFNHQPAVIFQLPSVCRQAVPYADSVRFPISVSTVNSRHCWFDEDGAGVDDGMTVYRWPVVEFVQLDRCLRSIEYAIRP